VIDTGKIVGGYDSTYRLVVTELGGATISLPGTDPIGWVDDNQLIIRDISVAWPDLVLRSVDVTHPVSETTVLFTSVEDPANPGPCAEPIQEAGAAAMPDGRIVITRSACSAGLITVIDLPTGDESNVRLPPRYSAVYPSTVLLSPQGTIVLPLTDRGLMQPDPIVAIHGATITQIGVGTGP
jgi:hypothetical protein